MDTDLSTETQKYTIKEISNLLCMDPAG